MAIRFLHHRTNGLAESFVRVAAMTLASALCRSAVGDLAAMRNIPTTEGAGIRQQLLLTGYRSFCSTYKNLSAWDRNMLRLTVSANDSSIANEFVFYNATDAARGCSANLLDDCFVAMAIAHESHSDIREVLRNWPLVYRCAEIVGGDIRRMFNAAAAYGGRSYGDMCRWLAASPIDSATYLANMARFEKSTPAGIHFE